MPPSQVRSVINLLDQGATVPFIARYRKEATQGLDEQLLFDIQHTLQKFRELEKRKTFILSTIKELGQLTQSLESNILACWDAQLLEDYYLPFKPKRKTRATIAREAGLEPLAAKLKEEPFISPESLAKAFVNDSVKTTEDALAGARDILAEWVSEDVSIRSKLRKAWLETSEFSTKVIKGKENEAQKYRDYFQFSEKGKSAASHRILAMLRAEKEGFLRLSIQSDTDYAIQNIERAFVKRRNECSHQVQMACADALKRLIAPSLDSEFIAHYKEKAEKDAISIFALNLRQLLLSSPLGPEPILALDPGFRTGCKAVSLSADGQLIDHTVLFPFGNPTQVKEAENWILTQVKKRDITAIAVGDGTAGKECLNWILTLSLPENCIPYSVNENGASVYSASEVARKEFPTHDITVRGAVSIGRRLADPLSELVKIDPKSIGVGQYQHDVNQGKLQESLDDVVISCVNKVGVNLNTASESLLKYVAGLGPALASSIVQYRNQNGPFLDRNQLKKVPRLGPKAFEQAAGFLRIPESKNPLDNSAVHPESYAIVEKIAKDAGCSVRDLIAKPERLDSLNLNRYITENTGLPTLIDIRTELKKPGRDPREKRQPDQVSRINSIEELYVGMQLPGTVTNITAFGCFVNIGIKEEGLVHISQIANQFVKNPAEIVKLNQKVVVSILEIDLHRKRVSLSMKGIPQPA